MGNVNTTDVAGATQLIIDEVGRGNLPTETLDVRGTMRLVDGNEGVGLSLVDDGAGTGVATWGEPASIGALTYGGISIATSPEHVADSVAVVGNIIAGSVVSTRTIDGVYLQVQENVRFDIQFTFIGLTGTPRRCEFRGRYEGNPAHTVFLYQYNYTTTAWDRVTAAANDFASSATDYTLFFELNGAADYEDGAGEAQLRIYHTSAPNVNHDMYVDFIALTDDTIDMPVAGTFYQITGLNSDPANNLTVNGAAGTMTVIDSGDYILTQTASFLGLPDAVIRCNLFVDGVDDTPLWLRKLGASGDVGSAGATIVKTLTAAEVLSWRFCADTPDAYISTLTASMTLLKVG